MLQALNTVLESALDRLARQTLTYMPAILAAIVIMVGAWLAATVLRWLIMRIFKGRAVEQFLRQSGLSNIIDRTGQLRASRLVANLTYWTILFFGFLTALDAFNTELSARTVQGILVLVPKLLVGGLILLGGAWLAQYLSRSTLVWAVNEGLPTPRRWAAAVRLVVTFVSVVVAADQINFAESVFLAAFIILVGGAMLALALAVGLGSRQAVQQFFQERYTREKAASAESDRPIWNHL